MTDSYVDGWRIAVWLEETRHIWLAPNANGRAEWVFKGQRFNDSQLRTWHRWRLEGAVASHRAVDEFLTGFGQPHLMHDPALEEMWMPRPKRGRRKPEERLAEALKLYNTGAPVAKCERVTGIHRRRLVRELERLGIYRGPESSGRRRQVKEAA